MSDPKNLDHKISMLLDDLDQVSREDAFKLIKAFVLSQMEWNVRNHTVDQFDLETLRSYAIKEMTDMPVDTLKSPELTQERIRALAYTKALVSYLRSKGLISFTVDYKKKGITYI